MKEGEKKVDFRVLSDAIDAYRRHKGYPSLKAMHQDCGADIAYETMRRAMHPLMKNPPTVDIYIKIMQACNFPQHQIKNLLLQAGFQKTARRIGVDEGRMPPHIAAAWNALILVGTKRPDLWPSLVAVVEGFAKAAGVELSDDVLNTMKGGRHNGDIP